MATHKGEALIMIPVVVGDEPLAKACRKSRVVYIELLHLTSLAVKYLQHSPLYSVSFIRMHGKKIVSCTAILEMQAAWNLPSTSVSIITVVQLPCQLN